MRCSASSCAGGYATVCASGCSQTTITAAVNAIPTTALSGDYCVDVQDNGPYNEQVTLQGKNPNNFQIIIGTTTGAARPVVSPPATAAFQIANSSVTLTNVNVAPTSAISYGIQASSAYVTISSVNVQDPAGRITTAGILISSWSVVANSSVTVAAAHGLELTGVNDSVSFSTAVNNGSSVYALYVNAGSSHSLARLYASNATGDAGYFYRTASDSIASSTFSSSGGPGKAGVHLSGAPTIPPTYAASNTFTACTISNTSGSALFFDSYASSNTVSQCAITSAGSSVSPTLSVQGSGANSVNTGNLVTQSLISNTLNSAAGSAVQLNHANNTISLSTITSISNGNTINFQGSSNAVVGCYVANNSASMPGTAVSMPSGNDSNTISQSTMVANGASVFALQVQSSSNALSQDYVFNASGVSLSITGSYNSLSQSTVTSNSASNAFSLGGTGNIVAASYVSNPGGPALSVSAANGGAIAGCTVWGSTAVVISGSINTAVNSSVLLAANAAGSGLALTGGSAGLSASSNTISGGAQGSGVYLDSGNSGLIVLSTNVILAGARYGVFAANQAAGTQLWITSDTVIPAVTSAQPAYGLYLSGLTSGATIQNNAIVYRNSGSMGANAAYALYALNSSGLNIDHNRITDPGMVTGGSFVGSYFSGVQAAAFKFNDVNSTGTGLTNAYLVQLLGSTVVIKDDVFLSSLTVTGSSATIWADATSGWVSDYNDVFSSNSANALVWSAKSYQFPWSAAIGQDANSIAANPLWYNPSAGVEDFHPLSLVGRCSNPPPCTLVSSDGAASPTIDAGDPAEPFNLEPGPNGSRANQGSFGDTSQASESAIPPGNPAVSAVFISSAVLNWTAAPPPVGGYLAQVSTAADFSGALFSSATANPAATQIAVQGLAGSTTYYARVGATYGAASVFANVALSPLLTLAQAAGGGQIFAVWQTSITANWVPVSTQTAAYSLEASTMAGFSPLYASSATWNPALSTLTVSGLGIDATFYFRVGSLNWAGAATYAVIGSTYLATPPSALTNLATMPSTTTDTQAILTWTAPGAVLNLGTAASYNIRYSPAPITPANFAAAMAWKTARPVSGPAGTVETETVMGLTGGVTYYFALETANASGNVSALSNVVSYLTGQDVVPAVLAISPGSGQVVLISTTVSIAFNKAMSTSTFAGATLTAILDNSGSVINQPVFGTTSYLQAAETLVVTPAAPLSKNTVYLVQIATTVKDASGNPLLALASATFTTVFDHTQSNVIIAQGLRFSAAANTFGSDGNLSVSTGIVGLPVATATQKLLLRDRFSNPISVLGIAAADTGGNPMQPGNSLSVAVPYNDADNDGIVDGSNPPVRATTLALWWLNPSASTWEKLPSATVDTRSHTLTTSLPHFSTFGLIGAQDSSLSGAFAYPVPYVPSKQATRAITFQNLSSVAAIRIYTASGRLVREIDTSDGTGKATWDAKNSNGQDVASGVYLYVISNDQESTTGKLMVIR